MSFDLLVVTASPAGVVSQASIKALSYPVAARELLLLAAPYAERGYGTVRIRSYEWEVWKGEGHKQELLRIYLSDGQNPLDQICLKPAELGSAYAALELQAKVLERVMPLAAQAFHKGIKSLLERCNAIQQLAGREWEEAQSSGIATQLAELQALLSAEQRVFETLEPDYALLHCQSSQLVHRQKIAFAVQVGAFSAYAQRLFLEQTGRSY